MQLISERKFKFVSRLASQSGFVTLGNVFTLFVGLPFQIYLANELGAAQLGALGLFEVVAQTVGSIFSFGLGFLLVRFIPQYVELGQNRHVKYLLGKVFFLTVCTGFVAANLVMFGDAILLYWMPDLYPYIDLFSLTALMAFLGMLNGISQQALRSFFDIRYMILISSFLQLLIKVGITVFLLGLGWELFGYLFAVVVSSAVALIAMLWRIYVNINRMDRTDELISTETKKSWLSYSLTMYGIYILGVLGLFAERFLLAGMVNVAAVGVLLVIRQLFLILQVPLTIITTGVAPLFAAAYSRGDLDEIEHIYHIATDWGCRLGFPLLLFLLLFGGEVLSIYGEEFYKTGQLPFALLVIGQVFNLVVGPVGAMLEMVGHEKSVFRFNAVSSAIGFGFMFAFIPLFGLVGVAIGITFSMLYVNVIELVTMRNKLKIKWWSGCYARLSMPIGVVLCVLLLVKFSGVDVGGPWRLVTLLFMSYAIFIGVYSCAGMSNQDREIIAILRGKE